MTHIEIIRGRIDDLTKRYRQTTTIEDLHRLREARRILDLVSVQQDGGKANPRQEKGGPACAAAPSDSSAMDNRST